jgi:V8-like Glu-specific endopeptidase
VLLGERTFARGLESVRLEERVPTDELKKHAKLLEGFAPDHLQIDPTPQKLAKPLKRIPVRLDESLRYNTTIFGIDNRTVFQDTSYPWSAFGRCETNLGPFSGVMIGPRHILTCNHGVDWTPPPGYAADWLKFTPSYYNGNEPFGSSYATHVYWIKKDNNDGFSNGDEDQYDYVVLVLSDRLGDSTGWLGARRYTDAWDGLQAWWHIGYPSDLTSMQRPVYENWFSMDGDNNQSDEHQAIYHLADVFPGQSGGPMFGFWSGDVGPRAVAVQSWQNSSTNGASGGGDLVDLVIRARTDFP